MKGKFLEESVLLISVIKWIFLATCIGIIVGLSVSIFLILLDLGISNAKSFEYYYLLLPIALFLSTLTVKYLATQAQGCGTEKVIEAVHKYAGRIKPLVVPVKTIATIITIAMGGSAGKEGPAAMIGAGMSSTFASVFKFDERDHKKLVICGVSAGFASVFGTPIAGALFGVEVLYVGSVLYDTLLPSLIAGIVSYQVSTALGITYFSNGPLNFVPVFSGHLFIIVCLGGLVFGICSLLFVEMQQFFIKINKRIKLWTPFKAIAAGIVLVILTLTFSTRYLGLGLETIKGTLEGEIVPSGAFFLKMLFTSITLSSGGSGGIITPIFFIGSTAGSTFGQLLGFDPAVFAAIGMVSLLAGATNTPISASIMALELFGMAVAPYATMSCIISYLMTGHRSVYMTQVLSATKSSSIFVEKGTELQSIDEVCIQPREKSITGGIVKGMRKISRKKKAKE